jgi:hypothetical protein
MQGEEEERGELRGEGLGGGDADLGAGVGGDGALGVAGDRRRRRRCRWRGSWSRGDELALGGDGVGGFAGLGDEQAEGAGSAMGSR